MRVILGLSATVVIIESCLFLFTSGSLVQTDNRNQCNHTACTYNAMAEYATCQSLNLVAIPPQCSSAVYLDFRRNDLQYLDGTSLTGFAKLRFLYLEGNQIRNITPRAFEACGSLQQIFLQNNPIVIIRRDVFYGLQDLRHLYLNLAKLERIEHHAFDPLRSLERLFLSDNRLESLPPGLFHHQSTLQVLTLANNRLRFLASNAFRGLHNLWYLDLKNNLLMTLHTGLFNGMISLNNLVLSYNIITTIEPRAINIDDELHNLETINLQNNSIVSLRNVSNLERVSEIYVGGNPIQCDCHSLSLWNWYKLNEGSPSVNSQGAEVICHGPQPLVGQRLNNVEYDEIICEVSFLTTENYQKPNKNDKDFKTQSLSDNNLFDSDPFEVPSVPSEGLVSIPRDDEYGSDKGNYIESIGYIVEDMQPVPVNEAHEMPTSKYPIHPFIWMGVAIGTLLITVVILILLYRKWDKVHNIPRPTDYKKHDPPGPRITQNPMPDDDYPVYEEPVSEVVPQQVILRRDQNHSPIDRTNTDSAYLDDFIPDPSDDHTTTMPPVLPVSTPPLCDSCYVSLQSMQAMSPLGTYIQPQLMHSISNPVANTPHHHTHYNRPHSKSQPPVPIQEHIYSPTNEYLVGQAYPCIHNTASQPTQRPCTDPKIDPTWAPAAPYPMAGSGPSYHPISYDMTLKQNQNNPFLNTPEINVV